MALPSAGRLVAIALVVGTATARADPAVQPPAAEPSLAWRLPLAVAERPLTLPRFILGPELGFEVLQYGNDGTYANLTGTVSFGLVDDLTVRALVLPLQLNGPQGTGLAYGQILETRGPSLGATYRLLRGPIEAGVSLDARVFTAPGISGFAIIPGVEVRAHVTRKVRIALDASVNVTRGTNAASESANAVRLDVPITAIYNIVDPVYIGLESGLTIYDFNNIDNDTGIPVGVVGGYSVAGKSGPILDIDPFFDFPYFFTPLARSATNTGEFEVGLNVRAFVYL